MGLFSGASYYGSKGWLLACFDSYSITRIVCERNFPAIFYQLALEENRDYYCHRLACSFVVVKTCQRPNFAYFGLV